MAAGLLLGPVWRAVTAGGACTDTTMKSNANRCSKALTFELLLDCLPNINLSFLKMNANPQCPFLQVRPGIC